MSTASPAAPTPPQAPTDAGAPVDQARGAALDLLALAASVLITFLVFARAIRGEFLPSWDDGAFILSNSLVRTLDLGSLASAFTGFRAHYWAPLTWLSYALEYRLWGFDPAAFHRTSVVLHALDAGLAYLVAAALLEAPAVGLSRPLRRWAALAVALAWSLHPLRVEAVAWAAERKSVLGMFFALAAVLAYLRHVRSAQPFWRSRWYLLTFALTCASLLSKPAQATLPLLLVILDAFPLRRAGRGLAPLQLAEKLPLLAAAGLLTWLTLLSHAGLGFTLAERGLASRALVALRSVLEYLRLSAWPSGLSPFYVYPAHASLTEAAYLVPAALVLAATAAAVLGARRHPAPAAAWLAYLVALAPGLASANVSATAMADRFTYLPSFPLTLLAVGGAATALARRRPLLRRLTAVGAALGLAALAGLSVRQTAVWRDELALWSRPIEVSPSASGRVYTERSLVREQRGDLAGARADMDQAISIAAARQYPGIAVLYRRRASLRLDADDPARSLADLDRAVETAEPPFLADCLHERAALYRRLGLLEKAEADERAASRLGQGG